MNTHCIIVIAGALGAGVATLDAGPRTSSNYTITTDTTDAGGRRTTSASYTNDASIGGIAGVSTVAAPAETVKAGYIAQLYDAAGLTLTAASTNVNETATVQLAAWLALDDVTSLAVPATSVAWSVASGPLTGISTGGLATAGAVYQNTGATAQGVHSGFTGTLGLTVVNTLSDNFGTYAGDGLDDAWQSQYFGLSNPQAAPGADPDADGATNADEFNALTNPASGASFFVATSTVNGADLIISFSTVTGRTYTLQRSDTLAPVSWTNSGLPAPLAGTGAVSAFTIPASTPNRRFFRVQVGP